MLIDYPGTIVFLISAPLLALGTTSSVARPASVLLAAAFPWSAWVALGRRLGRAGPS